VTVVKVVEDVKVEVKARRKAEAES